jgi:hypothetical protein
MISLPRPWLLLALCLFSSCAESGRQVTRQELGNRWPLIVESGHVDCVSGALVFRHDGTTYALNGTALSKGYPGIDPIWKDEARALNHRPLKGTLLREFFSSGLAGLVLLPQHTKICGNTGSR